MTQNKVAVKRFNELYNQIYCDDSIAQELKEFLTFKVPNYQHHPLVKKRKWDGSIALFSPRTRLLYAGLWPYVKKFCEERNYTCLIGDGLDTTDEFSVKEATEFINSLNLPSVFLKLRDYQVKSFVHCVRHRRCLFISPTGSGKSLIIYFLISYFKRRTLVIVDSLNLLHQLFSDCDKYGFDSRKYIHLISSGIEKNSSKLITFTTWQSAARAPKEWFTQFELVIGDEAHRFKATSLKHIMENLPNCKYRFGLTGSLDGSELSQLTLEGLFGPLKQIVTTKKLIDQGHLADVFIKAIVLKYDEPTRKLYSNSAYEDEISFLYGNEQRNRFIENLALSLKGNTVLLFQRVDSHGVGIYQRLKARTNLPIYYVSGEIDGAERENIRKIVNQHTDSIIVASVGTFSTGIDIPNLNSIIIASPTKSVIRVIQTLGRGLRKTETKYICEVFDIADDLKWNNHVNHTLRHFSERMQIYEKQEFKTKLYLVELK